MTLYFQATTNLGWMHSWQRGGWVGDFYDDDNDEDDDDGKNDGDDDEDVFDRNV